MLGAVVNQPLSNVFKARANRTVLMHFLLTVSVRQFVPVSSWPPPFVHWVKTNVVQRWQLRLQMSVYVGPAPVGLGLASVGSNLGN